MTAFLRLLAVLPLGVLQVFGWLVGWATFAFSSRYRERFRDNAAQAGYAFARVRAAVGHAGRMLGELPRIWHGTPVKVQLHGADLIEAAHAAGHGVLLLTPHMGCFECAAQAYAQRFGAAHGGITVLYRPARKPWMERVLQASRPGKHLATAPATAAGVRQLVRALRSGAAVGLLPDQVPPLELGVWAPFFGRDAYTMTLAARLAAQPDVTTLLARSERIGWGAGYALHFRALSAPLPADPAAAAAAINREMERLVRECPQQYLWGYDRYKQPRSEGNRAARRTSA